VARHGDDDAADAAALPLLPRPQQPPCCGGSLEPPLRRRGAVGIIRCHRPEEANGAGHLGHGTDREGGGRPARGGDSSFSVRAAVYTPAKTEYLRGLGADEVVRFDLQDEATWGAALEGVGCVYSASLDPLLEHHLRFSAHLGSLGEQIKHVVRISCMGADTNTVSYDPDVHVSRAGAPVPLMLQHYWWGEKSLIDAGVPVTVLRANFFMNHLLKTDIEQIDGAGWFSNPLGDTRNSFVCTNDIGEAAAVCLQEGPERHANKFYDLTGPEPQSMSEIASDLGNALGKPVEYRPQSFEQFETDFGPTRAEFFEYHLRDIMITIRTLE
jgi:uncharacterized protein YbjT (DUF2867 family)